MESLAAHLMIWGAQTHGWTTSGEITDDPVNSHRFRVGPVTGCGETFEEAINYCADGLIEEGWPDTRPDRFTHREWPLREGDPPLDLVVACGNGSLERPFRTDAMQKLVKWYADRDRARSHA